MRRVMNPAAIWMMAIALLGWSVTAHAQNQPTQPDQGMDTYTMADFEDAESYYDWAEYSSDQWEEYYDEMADWAEDNPTARSQAYYDRMEQSYDYWEDYYDSLATGYDDYGYYYNDYDWYTDEDTSIYDDEAGYDEGYGQDVGDADYNYDYGLYDDYNNDWYGGDYDYGYGYDYDPGAGDDWWDWD